MSPEPDHGEYVGVVGGEGQRRELIDFHGGAVVGEERRDGLLAARTPCQGTPSEAASLAQSTSSVTASRMAAARPKASYTSWMVLMLLSALTWIPPCRQLDCYRYRYVYRYVAGIRAGLRAAASRHRPI
jgi:hypothetical protein